MSRGEYGGERKGMHGMAGNLTLEMIVMKHTVA